MAMTVMDKGTVLKSKEKYNYINVRDGKKSLSV